MPASRTQRALTAERRRKNLAMRLGGAGWDRIAEELDYASKAAACKDFTRAMSAAQAATAESAVELRALEMLRLDRLQAAFWARALGGDHRAGKVVLDVHDRRVKLLDLTGQQRTLDNAVDAWLHTVAGDADDADLAADRAAADQLG